MKNKRKHPEQADKAEDLAKRKLAKLSKVAKPDSPKVLEIKQKVAEVLESRKNANNIVDIIGHLEVTAHSSAAKAAINGVKRIFSLALERREVEEGKEGEETAEAKYKGWVYDRLLETVKKLCAVLQHSQTSVSSLALATLLSFMRSAHQAGGTGGVRAAWGPLERQVLHSVVLTLVSTKRDVKGVVVRLAELLGFSDVKQHLLRILKKTITTATAGGKVNNFFIDNVINVLEVVDLGCLDSAHTLLCRFIHNLLHRHQGLLRLLHHPSTDPITEDTDPFDDSCLEPEKSGAIESSLWEVETLQSHALPQVSQAAKDLLEKGLREQELDVSALLEQDWLEVFEAEVKKKVFPNVPLNWEKPDGLKMAKDDILSEIFAIA